MLDSFPSWNECLWRAVFDSSYFLIFAEIIFFVPLQRFADWGSATQSAMQQFFEPLSRRGFSRQKWETKRESRANRELSRNCGTPFRFLCGGQFRPLGPSLGPEKVPAAV